MRCEHQGLAFDMPEGWQKTLEISAAEFHGPNWRSGAAVTIIFKAVGVGTSGFEDWDKRRAFYLNGEGPEAGVERLEVSGETNALVFTKPAHNEISIVRDGIHYIIVHSNDDFTREVIKHVLGSIQFPTKEATEKRIQDALDPRTQALMRALNSPSPADARRELESGGEPGTRVYAGTLHHVPQRGRPTTKARRWWWPF